MRRVVEGIQSAAPILLITGAGGAFGAMLKITPLGDYLGSTLSALGIGLFMPFVVAAALRPHRARHHRGTGHHLGAGRSAAAAARPGQRDGPGADGHGDRCRSDDGVHANDSFFWVVTQFSRMTVSTAYRAQTLATLVQGIAGMLAVWLLSLVLL